MYGVLFGYAPEVFPTEARGTGDALTATANRLAGILAPIIFNWGPQGTAPVLVAAALFMVAGCLMLALPIETAGVAAL